MTVPGYHLLELHCLSDVPETASCKLLTSATLTRQVVLLGNFDILLILLGGVKVEFLGAHIG